MRGLLPETFRAFLSEWVRFLLPEKRQMTPTPERLATLVRTLEEIAALKGKTRILGPTYSEEERKAYSAGANQAFEHCAAMAAEALAEVVR